MQMRMLTTLLFITVIISCKTFVQGFTKGFTKLKRISKTKLNARITGTTFYKDDDGNDRRRKMYNYGHDYRNSFLFDSDSSSHPIIPANREDIEMYDYETLYTLIWYDCEDCRKLLEDVKNARKKILYIDGTYYFYDENDETNTPIFYKDDKLIATDIFSIYEELFYN
jgi:hypothetical protein